MNRLVLMPPRSPLAGKRLPADSPLFDPSPADPTAAIAEFLPVPPAWFVVGGLGDGDEARHAVARWPGVRCLGYDPDPHAVDWQVKHGWPGGWGNLSRLALSDRAGRAVMRLDQLGHSSLHPLNLGAAPTPSLCEVEATTLDAEDAARGPFEGAALWLDLEGWDYYALLGGEKLLRSGRVLLVNAEVRYETEAENAAMEKALKQWGFWRRKKWFAQWWGHNEVWTRA